MEGGGRENASIKRTAGRLGCWERKIWGSFVSVEGLCEVKTACPGPLAPLFLLAPLSTLIGLHRAEIHAFPYSNDTKFPIEGSFLFWWQKSIQDDKVTSERA